MSSDEARAGEDSTRQGGSGSYFKEKPVKVGEEIDVTISEVSRRGDGVARIQGFVIFVPTARQGQQARIKITAIRPNFATAEIVSVKET